jgi:hypothetical protein
MYVNACLLLLTKHLTSQTVRLAFDDSEMGLLEDTIHFFYAYNDLFRYLDPMKPIRSQGFSCECLLYDSHSTSHITLPCRSLPPHNSLLSPEEDEFFHHASKVYQQ